MTTSSTPRPDSPVANLKPQVLRTHLSLFVTDPEASARWYADVLNMEITARGPEWVFLSFGVKHHDIALIRAAEGAQLGGIGLQHYGLEVAGDIENLRRLHAMLLAKGVEIVKTTDHKVGFGLYFNDPDGNRFEFFCETVHDDQEGKRVLGEYHAPSIPTDISPLYS